MMMTNTDTPTLDDVLNEFMAENPVPTADAIEATARLHPQYRRDLIEFAAAWAEQMALPPTPELNEEKEKAVVNRAMSHVANVSYARNEFTQSGRSKSPLTDLLADAETNGYTPEDFAKECGIDLSLLDKLNKRKISPDTIPPQLLSQVSRRLNRVVAIVADFFAGPLPATVTRSMSTSKNGHEEIQQSFEEAVRESSLTAEEKAHWLAIIKSAQTDKD